MNTGMLDQIPANLINFILVVVFSLLIGMEQRRHYKDSESETLFGTDRTFTLLGILGFILYVISPESLVPFILGGVAVATLISIYYYQKMKMQQRFGMTSLVAALITYAMAPFVCMQPHWLALLVVVSVLTLLEIKQNLLNISKKFDSDEFISLAKFLVLAGVILPILPDQPISDQINISPYHIWLAIVVVSSISYFSYLLRKFIFPDTGILLTGVLGGLYSSTATTVILARKSKEEVSGNRIIAAMFLALTMMYFRIFLLSVFFNKDIAMKLLLPFTILILLSALMATYFIKFKKADTVGKENEKLDVKTHQNPLEFKTAMLFGGLFVVFGLITSFVIKQYGGHGVSVLAFVVGVTDIDPFIINLFQGKWNIDIGILTAAVLNAITSNNALKMIYSLSLGDKSLRREIAICYGIIIVAGIAVTLI
jgi:uncharacterized membrane protein (DUF4010 family)